MSNRKPQLPTTPKAINSAAGVNPVLYLSVKIVVKDEGDFFTVAAENTNGATIKLDVSPVVAGLFVAEAKRRNIPVEQF